MKKYLSKITAIISGIFGLTFIILLICTAFGGLSAEDFDNGLVKALLFVFGGCYLLVTAAAIALQFGDRVTVREVQVAQGDGGNIKVTPAVVRSLIKKNISVLDGIKFRRLHLFLTEFGVQITVVVAYSDGRRVEETGAFLQKLITDVCERELDLSFHKINIRVVGFKSVYIPDVAALEAETQSALGKQPVIRDDNVDPVYVNADAEAQAEEPAQAAEPDNPAAEAEAENAAPIAADEDAPSAKTHEREEETAEKEEIAAESKDDDTDGENA